MINKSLKVLLIIVFVFITILVKPNSVVAKAGGIDISWNTIQSKVNSFETSGDKKDFDASELVSGIANILTTIGVVIVLAGILILGIKYMTASPDEAAKLKTKLVGLVLAGIVILGAYGIWAFTKNTLETIT